VFMASTKTTIPATRTSRLSVTAAGAKSKKGSKKSGEFCYGIPGSSAPFVDFDPIGLSKDKDENTIKRYREAELTHGRVSMVAALGFIVGENFNPLFEESITGPAITQFQQVPTPFWIGLLGVVGIGEFTRANLGWVAPGAGKGAKWIEGPFFLLNDNYTPGSIGWDPLGIKPTDQAELDIMQTKELNHGRLAMISILGMIAQEEVSGLELFNLQDDGILNDANCVGTICDILEGSG